MLFLNADEIMAVLGFEEVMAAVEEALCIYEEKTFTMPERMSVSCGEGNLLLLMPCVSMGNIVTKLVTVFPDNKARNRPVIDGIVVLCDQSTGEILALMDGKTITAMRTGAVTGVSIRHLSRREVRSVGLVGCGVQGYYQLLYACVARDIERITLFDVNVEAVKSLIGKLRNALPGMTIDVAASSEALVWASDIVIAATTAKRPIFANDPELFKGKHCVAIGSFEPDVREYPDAIFNLVEKVWVDIDFAQEESGELLIPLEKGILKTTQVETLGHLIKSGRAPERGTFGTTFSKSVGMALFDLTAARLAFARAIEKGLGTEL
ncbi:MAG: ornithine cyclodeaminase family protein [Anaerolineae bacterium]|nr:ornithine cyclodeaminase family protein [Anaerolineae bacterium]